MQSSISPNKSNDFHPHLNIFSINLFDCNPHDKTHHNYNASHAYVVHFWLMFSIKLNSINFSRFYLFNISLQMSGTAVIALSVWTMVYKHQYVALLTSSSYQFCTYALLLAGIGALLSSIIGCCGVKRENRAIILIVSIFYIIKEVRTWKITVIAN